MVSYPYHWEKQGGWAPQEQADELLSALRADRFAEQQIQEAEAAAVNSGSGTREQEFNMGVSLNGGFPQQTHGFSY